MIRPVEWAVEPDDGGSGAVFVRRDNEDYVSVKWFCGDKFMFALDDLPGAVENVETVSRYNAAWLADKDTNDRRYAGMIVDGLFYADTQTRDGVDGLRSVPWADLVKALERAARDRSAEVPAADDEAAAEV